MSPLEEFAARLRQRRHAGGLSQEQLAERAAMHWTAISQLERALRNPSLRTVVRLAKALDVDPCDLVAGLDPW